MNLVTQLKKYHFLNDIVFAYFINFIIKFKELQIINIGDKMQEMQDYVNNLKRKIRVNKKQIIFVCIGTNEILWDSIGPLVGSYLKQRIGENKVLGDLKNNICSQNDLINYYPKIKNKFIVAIDSAIASKELAGEIFINHHPIVMGLGVNKNKGTIGDISIKAGISELEKMDEKYVKKFSEKIGEGICFWYQE